MPKFSASSLNKLRQCHPELQRLFEHVIEQIDCVILCGYRGEIEQEQAFQNNKTKLHYPYGKHNQEPSHAVDATPYPIQWDNEPLLHHFAGIVLGTASILKIPIIWGGTWSTLSDLDHFELQ